MASVQTLSDADRRLVAGWAVACAERVVPLLDADTAASERVREALTRARSYSDGMGSASEEISQRLVAVKAAADATTAEGAAAARAVAQAAAVAHMGAHALGAAAYAVKSVSLAHPGKPEVISDEIRWQLTRLSDEQRMALRRLPLLGTDSSGPLGDGLLSRGILGAVIRELQQFINKGEG